MEWSWTAPKLGQYSCAACWLIWEPMIFKGSFLYFQLLPFRLFSNRNYSENQTSALYLKDMGSGWEEEAAAACKHYMFLRWSSSPQDTFIVVHPPPPRHPIFPMHAIRKYLTGSTHHLGIYSNIYACIIKPNYEVIDHVDLFEEINFSFSRLPMYIRYFVFILTKI